MCQPWLNLPVLANISLSSLLKGELVVTRLNRYLAGFLKGKHNYGLEEDRYWGISSALERLNERHTREEYYNRLAI